MARLLPALLFAFGALAEVSPTGVTNNSTQREQALKLNEHDEIVFKHDARVLDLPLPHGRYRIEHSLEGPDHFITFSQVAGKNRVEAVLEVRTEAAPEAGRRTTVYVLEEDGLLQVHRVEMQGERYVHFF